MQKAPTTPLTPKRTPPRAVTPACAATTTGASQLTSLARPRAKRAGSSRLTSSAATVQAQSRAVKTRSCVTWLASKLSGSTSPISVAPPAISAAKAGATSSIE